MTFVYFIIIYSFLTAWSFSFVTACLLLANIFILVGMFDDIGVIYNNAGGSHNQITKGQLNGDNIMLALIFGGIKLQQD